MASWKMIKEFGRAIGKRTGAPNKTSKMIERAAGDSDAFLEGKRHGEFLKGKATDASYQATYDRLDDDAKAVFDAYDMDYERSYGPNAAYAAAVERAGVDPNDVPSDLISWEERFGFDLSDPASRNVDVSKRVDKLSAEDSEKALNADFDKAFDEAVNRASHNRIVKNVMGDDAEEIIRKNAIEMLKAGKSISDVLSILNMR